MFMVREEDTMGFPSGGGVGYAYFLEHEWQGGDGR